MPTFQRPPLELAEIVRRHGPRIDAELSGAERRILRDIATCRTAALGGHVESCDHCHHQRIAYNSCRNRHCPKCQASAAARWMEDRAAELLPVEYFHVVFTLPDTFNALALANKRIVYGVLFGAVPHHRCGPDLPSLSAWKNDQRAQPQPDATAPTIDPIG